MIDHDATVQKVTVGTATAGAGLASGLEVMQTGLSIVATVLGIGLTSWIIYKEIRAERERRRVIREREKHGEPLRRKSDKVN